MSRLVPTFVMPEVRKIVLFPGRTFLLECAPA